MADSDGTMVSISFPLRRGFGCARCDASMLFSIVDDDGACHGVHFLFALLHCDGSISSGAFYARLTNWKWKENKRAKQRRREKETWYSEDDDAKLEEVFFAPLILPQRMRTTKEPEWHPLFCSSTCSSFYPEAQRLKDSPHFFHQQKTSPSTHKQISHGSFRWICRNAIHQMARPGSISNSNSSNQRERTEIYNFFVLKNGNEKHGAQCKMSTRFIRIRIHSVCRWNKRKCCLSSFAVLNCNKVVRRVENRVEKYFVSRFLPPTKPRNHTYLVAMFIASIGIDNTMGTAACRRLRLFVVIIVAVVSFVKCAATRSMLHSAQQFSG